MKKLAFILLLLVFSTSQILDPVTLQPYMFQTQISGNAVPLEPTKVVQREPGKFPLETYEITMVRTSHQFLPQGFPTTTVFAYAGQTKQGLVSSFPGPSIVTVKDAPIQIIWTNNITGRHILPVDTTGPFEMLQHLLDEVPAVPHLHGAENEQYSDGQPFSYWTASGQRGREYNTLKSSTLKPNQAIFRYLNPISGLYFYHDHMIGMTRLNVYAGLAGGVYEVVDPAISTEERNIIKIYGNLNRKYFAILDKSFQTNGELYYPTESLNRDFTSWVPEFFGNTMTVNGKVWPKVKLQDKKYRLVFLNGCSSRQLNIYFEDSITKRRISFDVIRTDSDYLIKPLTLTEYFLIISKRIQIVIDLSSAQGDVIMKNNAAAPYPQGNPINLIEKFTGTIMKIQIDRVLEDPPIDFNPLSTFGRENPNLINFRTSLLDQVSLRLYELNPAYSKINVYDTPTSAEYQFYPQTPVFNSWPFNFVPYYTNTVTEPPRLSARYQPQTTIKQNLQYPTLTEGEPYFTTLINTGNNFGEKASIMIDGVSMQLGDRCTGATFKAGKTYDFYIINLTDKEHPMHMHFANFEVIRRYTFNKGPYRRDYMRLNGPLGPTGFSTHPSQLDVRPYLRNTIEIEDHEKLMTDIITAPFNQVTLARVRFGSRSDDSLFDLRGTNYVWHCHILEHEDNEMMRWYCLE